MCANIFFIFAEMTISWRFDCAGEYSSPVIVLEERYRYSLSSSSGEVSDYKCVNGCDVGVSVVTSFQDDDAGWSVCSKHLINISPLQLHTCAGVNLIRDLNDGLAGVHINR